jgi:hypothetical protein
MRAFRVDELVKSTASFNVRDFEKRYPDPALVCFGGDPEPETSFLEHLLSDASSQVALPFGFEVNGYYPEEMIRAHMRPPRKSGDTLSHEPGDKPKTTHGTADFVGTLTVVFLGKEEITIGRSRQCDLCFLHPTISGYHARIMRVEARWQLVCGGATNGTFLNKVRLDAERPAPLADGARIGFGHDLLAKFLLPGSLHDMLARYRSSTAPYPWLK